MSRVRLAIHFAAVPDSQHEDNIVVNAGNEPVIADAILPQLAEARPMQGRTQGTRVGCGSESLVQKAQDALLHRLIEFFELLARAFRDSDAPLSWRIQAPWSPRRENTLALCPA